MQKITESPSHYRHLEKMETRELLESMNKEDQSVPLAVAKTIPVITNLVEIIAAKMQEGGRLFYLGAGTSGRLGVLDASECPPTYGVPPNWVIGLIAGGDHALRNSVEHAEDDPMQGWNDLMEYKIDENDVVVGIAASGTTPYVIGALEEARKRNIVTGCITCNTGSPLAAAADHPIEVVVGPEFVTGSTRMKSGTAQKLVLNMISTAVMIRLGRVKDNRMVDMKLANNKLVDRGTKMVMQELDISYEAAQQLLEKHGSVRKAVEAGRD
ncbi:N-acetylmuramic acid 6-phosphate etherase [Flavilitoribacter nigricans]|uniref:N-acetylmuramic acid 6-phosphate etherase n=1 Tax=Flavilitoribacter nigricans (strain ATCC 23147 / DSM 23189 / NBRC 102662 / NCIMB 1420 / SS-2) TaxID=1122177 RepID=A0A2D0N5S9_FLAN2|nr:N-acetylmuramic acid 6-phosphate etherase [Flavilitoribacter nigricans]PHN03807.1 N-acetylmuramic acid 6-phosphate etherase [Flavilitoribacter nigricans DSM 23189 = NBRC 102662]